MHAATSILATNPIKLLQTNDGNVTSIKKLVGKLGASEHKTKLAERIRLALTVDELALEENFYIFDYGNAM